MGNFQIRLQHLPDLVKMAGVAVLYFVLAKIGLQYATVGENVTLVWPPVGMALAVLVLSKGRLWPGVMVGVLIVHATTGFSPLGLAIVTIGNTLEAVTGAYLLRRVIHFHEGFDRVRDVLSFVGLAMLISPILGAGLGTLALLVDRTIPIDAAPLTALTWWAGDALGILVVTPPVLIWATQREVHWSRRQFLEALVITLSVIVIGAIVFQSSSVAGENYPLAYLTYPFLIWVALRFGPRGTSSLALLISAMAVIGTFQQYLVYAETSVNESELFLCSFIMVENVTSMLLAAILAERKRADQELMRERDFATQMMSALGQGVSVTGESGRYEFVNPAFARMLGYKPEEIVGKLPQDITLSDDLAVLAEASQERKAGQPITYQARLRRADGKTIHALISGSPRWRGQEVHGAVTVITDLTEQKQVENALRESQARLQAVIKNLPFPLWATDIDGRYVLQSPASIERRGNLVGKRLDELTTVSEAQRKIWQTRNQRVLKGEILQGEIEQKINGEPRSFYYIISPIRDDDSVIGILGVDIDVSDLKRVERALKKTEESNYEFLERLKALHEVGIELSKLETQDELAYQAVALGRSKLKFDRLSIWFVDEDLHYMHGAFGTDEKGAIRDERSQILPFSYSYYPHREIGSSATRLHFNEHADLYDDHHNVIGHGWNALAYLQDGKHHIGNISTDNLLSQEPMENYHLELLALYANTIGHLCIRMRAEEKLREAEEKFSKAFHSNLTGITLSTLDDGRFVDVNDTFTRMLGYHREEIIGHTVSEVNTWEQAEDRANILKILREKGSLQQQELRFRAKSGELRDMLTSLEIVELTGKPYLLGMLQDITERKKTEDALQQSEARFRSIFEGASVGIVVLDREGLPVSMNAAFINMVGYSEAELYKMPFSSFTHPEDVADNLVLFNKLLAGEIEGYNYDKRYVRKDKAIVWVRMRVNRFPSQFSDQDIAVALVEDITERKYAEEALQQLTSELEERVVERTIELAKANERLTELDRLKTKFIADVSHELRTPLAVLNTRVYLLQHAPPEKHPEYLNALKLQLERLTDFVNAILDLSRLELGASRVAFGPINLNEIVGQVVTALSPRAELAGLAMDYEMENGIPPVRGELNQLAQVATNLIANALNYTPNGGVHISTFLNGEGTLAGLEVRDTGIGIHPEDLSHLFERFYRGEQASQSNIPGSGLGLSIVKEIVDMHNGHIEIESDVGKGTTFRVWLPLWKD